MPLWPDEKTIDWSTHMSTASCIYNWIPPGTLKRLITSTGLAHAWLIAEHTQGDEGEMCHWRPAAPVMSSFSLTAIHHFNSAEVVDCLGAAVWGNMEREGERETE